MRELYSSLRRLFHKGTPSLSNESKNAATPQWTETLWSDSPISRSEEDRFNRRPFAARIADILARRRDESCLVIGVYGVWGEGKTSTLNLIEAELERHRDLVVVRFNPWYFRSEELLLLGFFSTLAEVLGKRLPSAKQDMAKLLRVVGVFASLASVTVGGQVTWNPGEAFTRLGEELSGISLKEAKKRVEAILGKAGKRVVVLIDDIDRLDRSEIQGVFKLVKLSADFKRLAYVLAFDDLLVASSLGEKYGPGGAEGGRQFLEKIVQLPLMLPRADELALRSLAFDGVNEALHVSQVNLNEEEAETFVNLFVPGLEQRMRTPRQARRYGNALLFALPTLRGEVNVLDQLLIEGIHVFYPELHAVIRTHPEVFIGRPEGSASRQEERQKLNGLIGGVPSGMTDLEQRRVRGLLEYLFPRTGDTTYSDEWEELWARKQRLCSRDYFERYFTYSVSHFDVPDFKLKQFLDELTSLDVEEAARRWKEMVTQEAAARVVRKLRYQEDEIALPVIPNLCRAVVRNGMLLPRERGFLSSITSTEIQAAIFVSKVVRRLPSGEGRHEVAQKLVTEGDPLPFAAEVFGWLRSAKNAPPGERILAVEVEQALGGEMADRIRDASERISIVDEYPERGRTLLWIWNEFGNKPGEAAAYLEKQFNENPQRMPQFLISFTGKAYGMFTGLPSRADFRRDAYSAVIRLINPEVIIERIKGLRGEDFKVEDYYVSRDLPAEETVVRQFVYLHTHPPSSETAGEDPFA